ncbi:MAG: hypothetical protein R3320_11405, partial [Nitriliruptorales bacterium]|nr:hypothetical protein [Nitriliruptorales bacterium]
PDVRDEGADPPVDDSDCCTATYAWEFRSYTLPPNQEVRFEYDFDGALPADGDFTTGGRDNIFLSYQLSWSFVEFLRERYGDEQVGRFYEAAGAGAIGEPGTEQWHVDRAAREVFGQPLEQLQEAWRNSLP